MTKGLFIISCSRMRRSLVKFVSFCEGCDQNVDRVSKNDKICHICIRWFKMVLVSYEKSGTPSINLTLNASYSGWILWRVQLYSGVSWPRLHESCFDRNQSCNCWRHWTKKGLAWRNHSHGSLHFFTRYFCFLSGTNSLESFLIWFARSSLWIRDFIKTPTHN